MKLVMARRFAFVSVGVLVAAVAVGAASSPGPDLRTSGLEYDETLRLATTPPPQYVAGDSAVECADQIEMKRFLAAGHLTDGLTAKEMLPQFHLACGRGEMLRAGQGFDVLQRYDGYARVFVRSPGVTVAQGYERWVPLATIERAAKQPR